MGFDPIAEHDDVNEAAVTDWKTETTARERIKAVITRTTEPTPASEISERARAPVVRDELTELTEIAIQQSTQAGIGSLDGDSVFTILGITYAVIGAAYLWFEG